MEKVLNGLYEIEQKANRILENTTSEKARLNDEFHNQIASLEETIKADTTNQLNQLQSNMEKEILAERLALFNDCNQQLKSMEDNFTNHHDMLVAQVFGNITKN